VPTLETLSVKYIHIVKNRKPKSKDHNIIQNTVHIHCGTTQLVRCD